MLKINFLIIFFLFVFVIIDGTDDDLFDDLWKTLESPTPKNFKNQKFGEINIIKQEIVVKNENNEQENANKIEMEDIKPIKIKEPKIELGQLNEESFEKHFDQQADQNVSFVDLSNSANDKDYNNMNTEEINEMEIVNEFNLMNKELRKENISKNLTNVQFEREIAKKLGTNRNKIYKLKKKLGQIRERTEENEETKMELITKFDQIRKEKIYGFKYDKQKRNKIEHEIANELGINRHKIYQWKRQLGIIKKFLFTNEEKIEKIKQFEKVKEEFLKKFYFEPNRKIESKISEKIGVAWVTIYKWKRKFGLITRERKIYSVNEKLECVKRSEEIAQRNLTICEKKIAETLGIPNDNLRRWTRKFGTKPIPERKRYSDAEKLDYVKRSEEMRKRNSMINERKIAEKFGINRKNLRRWTEKFGTKSR